jgi:hypothetical protein
VLYSLFVANYNRFSASMVTGLAAQFLKRAEEQGATTIQMLGHRLAGVAQATVGNFVEPFAHSDRVIAFYNPAEHRQLAARFRQDIRVAALCFRSWVRWMLGYPDAALADSSRALQEAREVGQGISVMYSLYFASYARIHCGEYEAVNERLDELIPMATEKNAAQWRGAA